MTILLQWLVEHAWIFYAACAVGALVYVLRAFAAYRQRSLALFTLERETATSRIVRAWAMVLVFLFIGGAIFVSANFVLPTLPVDLNTPPATPTAAAGVAPPTPGITPTSRPTAGPIVPTFTPATSAPASTPPPPPPPAAPTETPALTDTPDTSVAGEVNVRFGDFAQLVGYSLPATEVTTAQPLQLTLRWRALEGTSPVNYTVFTHLILGDDTIVAQDDDQPADGARPMTGWTAGETIIDPHPMVFYDIAYTGPAKIAVGLWDPTTGRVLTNTGDDRFALPVTINIVSQ
jgi:hypothetical protein